MLMDDLLQSKLFKKLPDSSQEISNDETQHAYENFITKVVALNQSESDYQTLFRSLNFIRVELIFLQSLLEEYYSPFEEGGNSQILDLTIEEIKILLSILIKNRIKSICTESAYK